MIPVVLQAEPNGFDVLVRQPGLQWLAENNIDLNGVPPKASELPAYWQRVTEQLWRSYSRSEEHTSELQSRGHLVCRLLLEKKNTKYKRWHRNGRPIGFHYGSCNGASRTTAASNHSHRAHLL